MPGDIRIQRRQLVHQLPGPLHDRLARADAPAATSLSAPATSSRSSSTQRTTCGGGASRGRRSSRLPELLADLRRHRLGEREIRARNQKCRASDLKSAVGMPVATTTRRARMLPPAVYDVGGLAVERDPLDRRALEDLRAALGGRGREPEARAIRIDRRAVAAREAPTAAASADFGRDGARVERRRLEPGVAPRLLLALRAAPPVRASARPSATLRGSRWHLRSSRRSSAAKSSAARRQACHACRAARRPSGFSTSTKLHAGIVGDPAGGRPAGAPPDPVRFDSATLMPAAANA